MWSVISRSARRVSPRLSASMLARCSPTTAFTGRGAAREHVVGEGADEGAFLRHHAHEVVALELGERLAHGGAAHAEASAQLALGEGLARVELALEDGLAECSVDRVGQVRAGAGGPGHPG